jgi:hypothetical protein
MPSTSSGMPWPALLLNKVIITQNHSLMPNMECISTQVQQHFSRTSYKTRCFKFNDTTTATRKNNWTLPSCRGHLKERHCRALSIILLFLVERSNAKIETQYALELDVPNHIGVGTAYESSIDSPPRVFSFLYPVRIYSPILSMFTPRTRIHVSECTLFKPKPRILKLCI